MARFLLGRGYPYPSSAALGKLGGAYVESIHRFAEVNHIQIVHFKKGESKEDLVRPYVRAAAEGGEARVLLIGIAHEKACFAAGRRMTSAPPCEVTSWHATNST